MDRSAHCGAVGVCSAELNRAWCPAAKLHGNLDSPTVLDLQRDMNRHRLSSVSVTAFYLARIHQLNPSLHAVIKTNPDALREAVASDVHRRLHGARSARGNSGSA